MYRCHASRELTDVLNNIAGGGSSGLWWSADEAMACLARFGYNWSWTPSGSYDLDAHHSQTNRMSHMLIFFKDPNAAMRFKLTWI